MTLLPRNLYLRIQLFRISLLALNAQKARQLIEQSYEKLLIDGGGAGIIFALKNLGWKDKQEIEASHTHRRSLEDFYEEVNE